MTSPVLVTGATGYLGSAVVGQCRAAGLRVRGTGRRPPSTGVCPDYVAGDLQNGGLLPSLLDGVYTVVHAAGLAHQFHAGSKCLPAFMAVNADASGQLARAAVRGGVRHFILLSSVSVYGEDMPGPVGETAPCRPEGPYACSKYRGEQQAIEACAGSGMALTILRLATVYGDGDPGNIGRLMRAIDRGSFLWIGSGRNRKSLIYRGDVARAVQVVVQAPAGGVRVYNVSAPPCTMREVVEGLASALERHILPWRVPSSLALALSGLASHLARGHGRLGALHGTVRKWLADAVYESSKFEQEFGFQPQVGLAEGLRRQVKWYRARQAEQDTGLSERPMSVGDLS
jgi:nucleoside-diphosphate-sugar epimerase